MEKCRQDNSNLRLKYRRLNKQLQIELDRKKEREMIFEGMMSEAEQNISNLTEKLSEEIQDNKLLTNLNSELVAENNRCRNSITTIGQAPMERVDSDGDSNKHSIASDDELDYVLY